MAKLVKLIVLIGILALLIGGFVWWRQQNATPAVGPTQPSVERAGKEKPRLEEKYGYTSEGVGGGG